ncbi:MAG: GNAT family N-acetyltransferase [Candidatus Izemoplasmatales bacterium]
MSKQSFIESFYRYREWDFAKPVLINPNETMGNIDPVALWRSDDRIVLDVAPELVEKVKGANITPELSDREIAKRVLGNERFALYRGVITFTEQPVQQPPCCEHASVRILTRKDKKALELLKTTCSEPELAHGQVAIDDDLVVGMFKDDVLVGVASLWFWGDDLADIGVITGPNYRNDGVGRSVVAEICNRSLALGRTPIYRCDDDNIASVKLALSLGFEVAVVGTDIIVEE